MQARKVKRLDKDTQLAREEAGPRPGSRQSPWSHCAPVRSLETGSWEQALRRGVGGQSSPHLGTRWKLNSTGKAGQGAACGPETGTQHLRRKL